MKLLFITVWLSVFAATGAVLPSQEMSSSINKSATEEYKDVMDDLESFYDEILQNSPEKLEREFGGLIEKINQGIEVNQYDFYANNLQVDILLLTRISNYDSKTIELLSAEINNSGSTGEFYQYYTNVDERSFYDGPLGPVADDGQCAPECCGGWRPIRLTAASSLCLSGVSALCVYAAEGWYQFYLDGCLS